MTIECEKGGGINLAQGVCDTEVPSSVRRVAQAAIDRGFNSYTRYSGLEELRKSIARKLREFNRIVADPDTEIIVSAGSTGAFHCTCLALLNPGDKVILFEPYYGYHLNTLLAVEAVSAYVTLQPPQWAFTRNELERAITARTKAIVVNTPANPSGKVFSRTELEWIAGIATRNNLFIYTDEIYEYFVYNGRAHLSPAALPGMLKRTVTISGFSKTYSITGWRIGYSVSKARWTEMIGYMNDLVYVCAPAPLQYGVAVGVQELDSTSYWDLAVQYAQKRDDLCEALRRAGLPPHVPEGAYYVLADASRLPGVSGKDRAMALLARTGVASVPGSAFYAGGRGENLLRFCFAKTDEELDEACRRIESLGDRA